MLRHLPSVIVANKLKDPCQHIDIANITGCMIEARDKPFSEPGFFKSGWRCQPDLKSWLACSRY